MNGEKRKPEGSVVRPAVGIVKDGDGYKVYSELVFAKTRTEEEARAEAEMISIGMFDKNIRTNGGRLAVNMSRELRNLGFGLFDDVYFIAYGKPASKYDFGEGTGEGTEGADDY